MPNLKRISILGVDVDPITIDQAVEQICHRARSNEPATFVTKPYVEFLDTAATKPWVRNLLNEAWLSLPDSVSIQWASTYLAGKPSILRLLTTTASIVFRPKSLTKVVPERFAGLDFTWKLLEGCQQKQLKIFLIGSPTDSTIEHTAATAKKRYPNLDVCGVAPGQIDQLQGPQLLQALRDGHPVDTLAQQISHSGADIILVGMGFPLQEVLMQRLSQLLDQGILIGEGGSFDYTEWGGNIKRAPKLWRRIGLEWLWRLLRQPSRLKRQLAIPRFIYLVHRSAKA